jgi:hypothetical protein
LAGTGAGTCAAVESAGIVPRGLSAVEEPALQPVSSKPAAPIEKRTERINVWKRNGKPRPEKQGRGLAYGRGGLAVRNKLLKTLFYFDS